MEPFWWTETFGWLAFVPRKPLYIDPLFERLARVPKRLHHYCDDGWSKYSLPLEMKESWVKLDWWLLCATSILAKEFDALLV